MSRAERLVERLAAAATRSSGAARRAKLRLLNQLAWCRIRRPAQLLRFHETLCFLRAYPDDAAVLAAVERELAAFLPRVDDLGPAAADRLRNSGIAGTTIVYPYGLSVARWLVRRFPADVSLVRPGRQAAERLKEVLALLVHPVEEDAFSEFGLPPGLWLRLAGGGRARDPLGLLVELFDAADLPEDVREWMFESIGLSLSWRLGGAGASRTLAELPEPRPAFATIGRGNQRARRGAIRVQSQIRRPIASLRRAPRSLARAVIEAARVALAVRLRELHGICEANPDDVIVADLGRGLRIALIGVVPARRLPIETFYGYLIVQNGVPIGYGGAWHLFGTLYFGVNIFDTFRRRQSAHLTVQALRVFHQVLGMRTVVLEAFQVGRGNPEALASGAFFFYRRLGFRSREPGLERLAELEEARAARHASYRSPARVLRKLAGADLYLPLFAGAPGPGSSVKARDLAALVSDHVARRFAGDREAASREARRRIRRLLGIRTAEAWTADERRAFGRLALLTAVIPDLGRWGRRDRHRLARVLRAKGARSEIMYARLLDGHTRLRQSLAALAESLRARDLARPRSTVAEAGNPSTRRRP